MDGPRWYVRRYSLSWEIVRPGFTQYLGRDGQSYDRPRHFRSLASAEKVCERANRDLARGMTCA